MESEKLKVDLHSLHKNNIVSKNWYYAIIIISKLVFFTISVAISYVLYSECLNCDKCNNLVIGYFSIISLCCLSQLGLQPDKLMKFNIGN